MKSLIDDAVAADEAGVRMMVLLASALEDMTAEDWHNTFVCFVVIEEPVRHTFCADHVLKEMPLKLESLTAEYDRWEGMVASSVRLP